MQRQLQVWEALLEIRILAAEAPERLPQAAPGSSARSRSGAEGLGKHL